MTAEVHTFEGRYYDGVSAVGAAATVQLGEDVDLTVGETSRRYAIENVRVSPRVGCAERFVLLPDGGQFQCEDDSTLDRLPGEVWSEGLVAWLEQRVWVAVVCIALIAGALGAGYFYVLPVAIDHVVARVAPESEQALALQMLPWLESWGLFSPTRLQTYEEEPIREGFAELHQGLSMDPYYRLEVRDAPSIGANAFALPGGVIVLTDQMVRVAGSNDEVLSILAHEIGHSELRHPLRLILKGSITALVVGTITADASSLGAAVTAVPLVLLRSKYSRDMESAADEFAFQLLRRRGRSPELFANLMERLAKQGGNSERTLSFLSTHPLSADRVARARAAARE